VLQGRRFTGEDSCRTEAPSAARRSTGGEDGADKEDCTVPATRAAERRPWKEPSFQLMLSLEALEKFLFFVCSHLSFSSRLSINSRKFQ
jgi:hypothetical protein